MVAGDERVERAGPVEENDELDGARLLDHDGSRPRGGCAEVVRLIRERVRFAAVGVGGALENAVKTVREHAGETRGYNDLVAGLRVDVRRALVLHSVNCGDTGSAEEEEHKMRTF